MVQTTAFKLAGVAIVTLLIAAGAMRLQRDDARTELATYRAQVTEATAQAQALARDKEAALLKQSEQLKTALAKEIDHAKTRQDRLVADIRSGAQRLSIAAHCPSPAREAPADPAAAPGAGPEGARAELDPTAAETLVAIAADGDTAIRERNACFEQYDAIRATLNGH